jgi:hypothetical protein
MKHPIILACGAFAVASTLTLAAQTPPTPQTPKPSPTAPAAARTDEKTITVSGCLKAWDAAANAPATGTPTTPGTTAGAPASRFVLTNVQPDTMAPRTETATTPGASSTTAMGPKQYVLTADAGVNLAAHLNHQVRVTGKATSMADHSAAGSTRPGDPARPGTVPAPKPTDPAPTTAVNDMAKAWSTLAVTSVTMVSATCTGATF